MIAICSVPPPTGYATFPLLVSAAAAACPNSVEAAADSSLGSSVSAGVSSEACGAGSFAGTKPGTSFVTSGTGMKITRPSARCS